MPKYYVNSGDLEFICTSDTPKNAAIKGFSNIKNLSINKLAIITIVSEHGFDSTHDDDYVFLTTNLLEETNQESFKLRNRLEQ
jgi:hypothetical protein